MEKYRQKIDKLHKLKPVVCAKVDQNNHREQLKKMLEIIYELLIALFEKIMTEAVPQLENIAIPLLGLIKETPQIQEPPEQELNLFEDEITPDDSVSMVYEKELSKTLSHQMSKLKNYIDNTLQRGQDKLIDYQKQKAQLRDKRKVKFISMKKIIYI